MHKIKAALVGLLCLVAVGGCTTNNTIANTNFTTQATLKLAVGTINDTAGGATGILFSSVAGPGTYTINDNLMNMTTLGPDRGIIFSSVTTGTIQLIGTQNNGIFNAATPFFDPVGTSIGEIIVNNVFVP